jgi:hypothetical protein
MISLLWFYAVSGNFMVVYFDVLDKVKISPLGRDIFLAEVFLNKKPRSRPLRGQLERKSQRSYILGGQ